MGRLFSQWQMGLLWGLFLILAFTTLLEWNENHRMTLTGDEPNYLVMTDGIVRYGSFDYTKASAYEAKTHAICKGPIDPHCVPGPHGRQSAHSVGLPIVLSVPFWLFGESGARGILVILASTSVLLCWRIASLHTDEPWTRFLAVAPVTLALPLLSSGGQIYPDMLAGLICLTALLWIQTIDLGRPVAISLLLGMSIAFLPWLQIKNVAPAFILCAMLTLMSWERRSWRLFAVAVVPSIISVLLVCAWNYHLFGRLSGPYSGAKSMLEFSRTGAMVVFGLFLDQHQGLLLQNPIQFIGLLSLFPLFRWNWRLATTLVLLVVSLVIPNGLHPNWYGGMSFAGRFGWSATIILMGATVFGLVRLQQASRVMTATLCGMAMTLQAYFYKVYTYGNADLYNRPSNTWLEEYGTFYNSCAQWLPAAYNVSWAYSYLPNLTFGVLAVACVVIGVFARQSFSRGTIPLLGLTACVCLFWGATGTRRPEHLHYFGKDLPSLVGQVSGLKRIATADVHQPGYLTYGPYIPLTGDKYELQIRYLSKSVPEQTIGKWDIYGVKGEASLAAGNFVGTNGWEQKIVVPFEVTSKNPEVFEFRNFWNGTASLEVIDLKLRRRL